MMATLEAREAVLVCNECLGDWSPEHRQHGQPVDATVMVERWRETLE